MARPGILTAYVVALLLAALLLPVIGAHAGPTIDGRDRDTLIRERRWNDLEELNRLESRQRFQDQQQQLRETDRRTIRRRMEKGPPLQQLRPGGCIQDLSGSKSFRTCR